MRFTLPVKLAAGLLVIWIVLAAGYCGWFYSRSWNPVQLPIKLVAGSHVTSRFRVNREGEYAIDIGAKGVVDQDRLGCLLGDGVVRGGNCGSIKPIEAHWTIRDLTDPKAYTGTSKNTLGRGYSVGTGSTHEFQQYRTLGYFEGKSGHGYEFELLIDAAETELAHLAGTTSVTSEDNRFESLIILQQLLIFFTPWIVLGCSAIFASSYYRQRRKPKTEISEA